MALSFQEFSLGGVGMVFQGGFGTHGVLEMLWLNKTQRTSEAFRKGNGADEGIAIFKSFEHKPQLPKMDY